jgi:toxin YoeB
MELVFDAIEAVEQYSNPLHGRGHVEALGENLSGCFSRQITEKHRLVYRYSDNKDKIVLVSCYGHYK